MSMTEEQANKFLTVQRLILKRVSVAEGILIAIVALFGLCLLSITLMFVLV